MMKAVEVELPYTNQREEPGFVLEIDPAAKDANLHGELYWMMDNASADEWERILRGWAILHYMDCGTLGECLRTAIIWERG
jgi:hypothetical protein